MAAEYTLSIIKPDAVAKNIIGKIYSCFEQANLKIVAMKMQRLNAEQAAHFYAEHQHRVFYADLINFMTSGPIVVQVLAGEQAINRYRELMGATDPKLALPGTLRAHFADSINANAVHGSDGVAAAQREIDFFFTKNEIFPR